jgi:hypothetical protein
MAECMLRARLSSSQNPALSGLSTQTGGEIMALMDLTDPEDYRYVCWGQKLQ